jgi:hypothetical protein
VPRDAKFLGHFSVFEEAKMRRHNKTTVVEGGVQAEPAVIPEIQAALPAPLQAALAAIAEPIEPVPAATKLITELMAPPTIVPEVAPVVAATAPKVRRFRVMRERSYVEGGMKCIVREGSIIDTATRDVELLRKQGVPLEELAAD